MSEQSVIYNINYLHLNEFISLLQFFLSLSARTRLSSLASHSPTVRAPRCTRLSRPRTVASAHRCVRPRTVASAHRCVRPPLRHAPLRTRKLATSSRQPALVIRASLRPRTVASAHRCATHRCVRAPLRRAPLRLHTVASANFNTVPLSNTWLTCHHGFKVTYISMNFDTNKCITITHVAL